MLSTSRPTYPTSVNFEASTLRNGELDMRARRRAISVLPTPVEPIMMMFLGITSTAISGPVLPSHAIAQGNGDGSFRVTLTDNVLIKLGHDLTRRHLVEPRLFINFSSQINNHVSNNFLSHKIAQLAQNDFVLLCLFVAKQLLNNDILIRINTNLTRDAKRLYRNLLRRRDRYS